MIVPRAVVQSARCTPANVGTKASAINVAPPSPTRSGVGPDHEGRPSGIDRDCSTRYRFGNTNSTTNRTMNGMAEGSPDRKPDVNHFVHSDASTPMARPPAKVIGRLRNAPRAAAPNACTTSSVRTVGSRGSSGANSTPEADANMTPITQAVLRTLTVFVPEISTRFGSSTTALIAIPIRLKRSMAYRPAVAISANPNVIRSEY